MTNPNRRLIVIVMDRSGSMDAVRTDTENGLRAFLADQRDIPGTTLVSLYQFDDEYEPVYELVDLADAPDYTLKPRGWTALLDAVGRTIDTFGHQLADEPEDQRPGQVVVVILTDGHENSSREYTLERVREQITHQTDVYGWTFVFLGADQDAFAAGGRMGIDPHTTLSYASSSTASAFTSTSGLVTRGSTGLGYSFTDGERAASTGEGVA